MRPSVDHDAVRARAWLLERHKVPRTWSQMVAEVWLRLDVERDGGFSHSAEEIERVAGEMGKEKLAVVRAVAFLTLAARSGLQVEPAPNSGKDSGATSKGVASSAGEQPGSTGSVGAG